MLLVALRFRETWLLSLSLLGACREAPPTPSAASASLRAASPAPGTGPAASVSAVPHLTVPPSGATVAASAAAVEDLTRWNARYGPWALGSLALGRFLLRMKRLRVPH